MVVKWGKVTLTLRLRHWNPDDGDGGVCPGIVKNGSVEEAENPMPEIDRADARVIVLVLVQNGNPLRVQPGALFE